MRWFVAALTGLSSVIAPTGQAKENGPPVTMEKFVTTDDYIHQLCFGLAITMWKDKNSGRVLEMYVKAVRPGSSAEREGLRPGTKIYGINGASVQSFDATFKEGSDLNAIFSHRQKNDRVTLEVSALKGDPRDTFVTLVEEQGVKFTFKSKIEPAKVNLGLDKVDLSNARPTQGKPCTSTRIQEKLSIYESLKTWEKKYIDRGVVAVGFTEDMVYMAVGKPSKVRAAMADAGDEGEQWTYNNYYPPGHADATTVGSAPDTAEAPYQQSKFIGGTNIPLEMSKTPQSSFVTGPPQGGTMEPADLPSFTFDLWFQEGKVVRMALNPS